MEDLAPAPQGVAERCEAQRHDHEFLNIDGIVRVLAAVDDVHHGRRQQIGAGAAQVPVQRLLRVLGGRLSHGHRRRPGLRWRPTTSCSACRPGSIMHLVDFALVQRVHADQAVGNAAVDVVDRREHAFPKIRALVPVA